MSETYQKIYSRVGSRDNMRILGHLNVSKTGQTAGGWFVTTWSENGAPYWVVKMHWLDKLTNKLYHPNLRIGVGINFMDTRVEDTDIEPERAKFIHEMIKEWDADWLKSQANT
jgi:hypothetical protein